MGKRKAAQGSADDPIELSPISPTNPRAKRPVESVIDVNRMSAKPSRKKADLGVIDLMSSDEEDDVPEPDPVASPADELNEEQSLIFEYVNQRNSPSIFLTGSAGTGKSYLLGKIIQARRAHYYGNEEAVAVTAPTGIAALNISGKTIHSFAGVGLAKGNRQALIDKAANARTSRGRWYKCKTLIIDEVSMLDSYLFLILDDIARKVKGGKDEQGNYFPHPDPFGGIQVILCGDFYQLPPVKGHFAFTAPLWDRMGLRSFVLKEMIRQKGDDTFADLLNRFRTGDVDTADLDSINECHQEKKKFAKDGIEPTKLYCRNKDVDAENSWNLNHLRGEPATFWSRDVWNGKNRCKLDVDFLTSQIQRKIADLITLKVGAQVLCLKNFPEKGLVNGSRGVVLSFHSTSGHPHIRWTDGTKTWESTLAPATFDQSAGGLEVQRIQLPLRLAWALTIHKCQGMTLARVQMKLSDAFESGQAYVALRHVMS